MTSRRVVLFLAAGSLASGREVRDLAFGVYESVNGVRRKHGLHPLRWRQEVASIARAHSEAMAKRGFFAHHDQRRGGLRQRMQASRIRWRTIGENIFRQKGYSDPVEAAVEGWMNSPSHRHNILNPEFRSTGVGIARSGDGVIYYTQDFTAP